MSEVDWATVRLGDVAGVNMGQSPPSTTVNEDGDGLPFIQGNAEFGQRTPQPVKYCSMPQKEAQQGDILLSVRAPVGALNLADKRLCIGRGLAAVTAIGIEATFLWHALRRMVSRLVRVSQGSTFAAVNKADLCGLELPLPAPGEQWKIAAILSSVDDAIEKTQEVIDQMQVVKRGLMQDLFSRGVTADGQLRPPQEEAPQLYEESPLGWIPRAWETTLLDDIAARGSGHTPNKKHPEYWDGSIKWVSLADSWRLDRVHISDTDRKITQAGIENSSAVLHPAGIVILSRDAGVGKGAVTTCEMAVSQHFMCWRCGPRLNRYFLHFWLQYRKREFERIATGSTIPTIGLRFFQHYRINVPVEIQEQRFIAASLLAAEKKVFRLQDELHTLSQLRLGLMSVLLTGELRVKPDPEAA